MLHVRPAGDEDCGLLWEWANDPEVRSSAFQSDLISWDHHVAWFRSKLADPQCRIYLALDELGPVGQVRFELLSDGSSEVDISIARERRGEGLGAPVLRLACDDYVEATRQTEIVAHVKSENFRSLKIFEKAGFEHAKEVRIKGQSAEEMVLRLPRNHREEEGG